MEPIPLVQVLKRGGGHARKESAPSRHPALPDLSELMESLRVPELSALREQADALLQQAQREAEQIRQQAYQQGYQEGYRAGAEEARIHLETEAHQQVAQLREQVNTFLQQLQSQFDKYLRLLEPQMLALTMQIARKVIRDELRQHPEHVLAMIRDVLRRVQGFGQVRIRVHPLDLELVRQHKPSLLTVIDSLDGLEIVEDRRVEPGGCILETPQGIYDARVDTQLEEMEHALNEALPEAG